MYHAVIGDLVRVHSYRHESHPAYCNSNDFISCKAKEPVFLLDTLVRYSRGCFKHRPRRQCLLSSYADSYIKQD
jgi:hypothetical protein